jgi:hypothetical protein
MISCDVKSPTIQGVFQERVNGRIKFHTYVVRE